MELCDCIKSLDLSDGITKEELCKYPCLAIAIAESRLNEEDCVEYINTDKLILTLFKAVKELKNEIDTLKAPKTPMEM